MKRDHQPPAPAQALRDLPAGSRLVAQSTTKVHSLEPSPHAEQGTTKVHSQESSPQTEPTTKMLPLGVTPDTAPDYPEPPPLPPQPVLPIVAPKKAPPRAIPALPGIQLNGGPIMAGRVHNPTVDAPLPHVAQAEAKAYVLRESLGAILSAIYTSTERAKAVLDWIETVPDARIVFARMGINLEEAEALLTGALAILNRFKPPVPTQPNPS